MTSLEKALAPNSDQLNADDLIAGPMTCTITHVRIKEVTGKGQQPIEVDLAEYPRPYRPCKSMGRLLLYVWGVESLWVGKRLTLYRDESVQFGGDKVGGIRISHVSDLGARQKDISLTATRGKKAIFTVRQLEETPRINAKELWSRLVTVCGSESVAKDTLSDKFGLSTFAGLSPDKAKEIDDYCRSFQWEPK